MPLPPGALFVSGRLLCVSGETLLTHRDENTRKDAWKYGGI